MERHEIMIHIGRGHDLDLEDFLSYESRLPQGSSPTPRDLQTTLIQTARQYRGRIYALVDLTRAEDFLPTLLKSGARYLSLFADTKREKYLLGSTILVYCGHSPDILEWLTRYGWENKCCTFLVSRSSFVDIHKVFKRYSIAIDSNDIVYLIRTGDPLVIFGLLSALDDQERTCILNICECIFVRRESLYPVYFSKYDKAYNDRHYQNSKPITDQFYITSKLENYFESISRLTFVNAVIDDIGKSNQDYLSSFSTRERQRIVVRSIEQSKYFGFELERDICYFIKLVVVYGEGFWRIPENNDIGRVLMNEKMCSVEKVNYMLSRLPLRV
jgi:hypothetical protein